MSAIKSLSSETQMNARAGSAEMMVHPVKGHKPQSNGDSHNCSYQKLVKKVAEALGQKNKNDVKPEKQLSLVWETLQQPTLEYFQSVGRANPILEAPMTELLSMPTLASSLVSLPQGAIKPEMTGEIQQEIASDESLGETREVSIDNDFFEEDIPLINMSGMPIIHTPYKEIIQQSNSLLSPSVQAEENRQPPSMVSLLDGENLAQPRGQDKGQRSADLISDALASVAHKTEKNIVMDAKPTIQSLSQGNEWGSDKSLVVEAVETSGADQIMMSSERFMQNLTKSEKKQSVLHESARSDSDNIVQNSLNPTEIEAAPLTQLQAQVTSPARNLSSVIQTIEQGIASSDTAPSLQESQSLPRTLTYTFQQWESKPSVTFDLATKSELIASTYSREMQSALQENKHLLGSDRNLYFRQEQGQERRQQEHQQEQRQQEED